MNTNPRSIHCPDCDTFSRRDFLKSTIGAAAASTLGGIPIIGRAAEEIAPPKSETLVATLYKSLTEPQRKASPSGNGSGAGTILLRVSPWNKSAIGGIDG